MASTSRLQGFVRVQLSDIELQEIIQQLHDPEVCVRMSAAAQLARADIPAASLVPAVVSALADPVDGVCLNAIAGLSLMGSNASAASPVLRAILVSGSTRNLRFAAARSLLQLGAEPEIVVPHFVEWLREDDDNFRNEVVLQLQATMDGEAAQMAVAALVHSLDDRSEDVRCNATWALVDKGVESRVAIPRLEAALNDPDESVRLGAARALETIRARHGNGDSPTAPLPDSTG